MNQALRVFVNAPAPAATAGWFDKMLGPAIAACRFDREPPPVEFRSRMQPLGRWRPGDEDGRVTLAGRIVLYSRVSIAGVYLHEVAHALIARLVAADRKLTT